MAKQIPVNYGLTYGTDPELFLSREVGKVRKRRSIVASEVVVPPGGLKTGYGNVARDGVQVELHPVNSTCRANLSSYIQSTIRELHRAVGEANNRSNLGIKIDFSQLVTVTPGDLNKMSPDARRLGCTPSKNAYGRPHIEKDGEKFRERTAAGHLHLGTNAITGKHISPEAYIHAQDVMVGNLCVMLDRNPAAARRRKTYGRAGEYRLPNHGIEYRTLSNFWMHNYVLMSMVFGMARVAHDVVCTMKPNTSLYPTIQDNPWKGDMMAVLMKDVDLRKIEQAINTNDYDLARSNYENWIRPFLAQIDKSGYTGVDYNYIREFDFFVDKVRAEELAGNPEPLTAWFKEDPLEHWLGKPDGHDRGFETFLRTVVRPEMTRQFGLSDAKFDAVIMKGVAAVGDLQPAPPIQQENTVPEMPMAAVTLPEAEGPIGPRIVGG